MYRLRNRSGRIGEFHDDEQFKTLWRTGITPIKLITYDGMPLVPPFCRDRLNADWREGVVCMGALAWYR